MSPTNEEPRQRLVIRWDPDWEDPCEDDMDFYLTYSGPLYAQNTRETPKKIWHKHCLRRHFHKQLKTLWHTHPVLLQLTKEMWGPYKREDFNWKPLVRAGIPSLTCQLDILLLRTGDPTGRHLGDIDNRLKTLFDALQLIERPSDVPKHDDGTSAKPLDDEDPFYVLCENDKLITAVTLRTDSLLEPITATPPESAVRLVIKVTVRPYNVNLDNLALR